ncbi:unnamed protein product [Durusdinium trenchii]|uniref:Uncharacterized protein n=1 Tax=Durusdinium trenchii TaxID=1381693 RepID=A0ABP0SNW8_9DINO
MAVLCHLAKNICSQHAAVWLTQGALRHVSAFPLSSLDAARDVGKVSVTTAAYAACRLNDITPSLRGQVLETVARKVFSRLYPDSMVQDPVPGEQCDGKQRGITSAEYDWLCDGKRVQCKSAQLRWCDSGRRWRVLLSGIKPSLLDDLVLVLYSPSQLNLFTHDCKSRLSTTGVRTVSKGLQLSVCGPRNSTLREAEDVVLKKLLKSGHCVASLKTSDELVLEALQWHTSTASLRIQRKAFAQHPLNYLTPSARGLLFQRVVQEVDLLCHSCSSHFTSTASNSPCDWHRDGLRVECKSARLAWSENSWRCQFHGINFAKFDMLYLALDSPNALHIFRFQGSQWVSSTGLAEETDGKNIRVRGPSWEMSYEAALDVIIQKLVSTGSEHLACVLW